MEPVTLQAQTVRDAARTTRVGAARGCRLGTTLLLALACHLGIACAQPAATGPAIVTLLLERTAELGMTPDQAALAGRFYASGGDVPAWSAPDDARAALALLDSAADEGLVPDDYGVPTLRTLLDQRAHDGRAAARFDIALTLAMLRYLVDLHSGRTRGAVLSYGPAPQRTFDAGALLHTALAGHRIAALPVAAAPSLTVYGRLRSALQAYRQKAAAGDTAVSRAGASAAASTGAAGDPAGATLRRRLMELGDLDVASPGMAGPGTGRDSGTPDLPAALKRFQRRHGLQEDGVAGPATLAALNVPLRQRVTQIALAMERLRWLPPLPDRRVLAINLPSYRLWAFDRNAHATDPVLDMRVIVGRAVRTPTPVFIGMLRYLEFNPYWNVPASILRSEIMPHLIRDPDYLRSHGMEVVQGETVTQDVVAPVLERLRSGAARVRQRPGPDNALGGVKFALPNPMNIYLHGTPARALFDAARRDFSHGCIRVEHPAALAGFVLGDRPDWNAAAIAAAMESGRNRVVPVDVPLAVVIFYATAIPEASGAVTFLEDVYHLDAALERRWKR